MFKREGVIKCEFLNPKEYYYQYGIKQDMKKVIDEMKYIFMNIVKILRDNNFRQLKIKLNKIKRRYTELERYEKNKLRKARYRLKYPNKNN